jgi:cell division protein FtsL
MNRGLVLLLGVLLFAGAMGLITAQHRARGLFVELERAQASAKTLEAEGDRLRIELGRHAQPASVESVARRLGLQPIEPARVIYLPQPAPRGDAAGSARDRSAGESALAQRAGPHARTAERPRDGGPLQTPGRATRESANGNAGVAP